jgi:hypothetical protein
VRRWQSRWWTYPLAVAVVLARMINEPHRISSGHRRDPFILYCNQNVILMEEMALVEKAGDLMLRY